MNIIKRNKEILVFVLCFWPFILKGSVQPDWSEKAVLPEEGSRENIYRSSQYEFEESKKKGFIHALRWPVNETGLLIPYRPFSYFLEGDIDNPLRKIFSRFSKKIVNFYSTRELYDWLGLLDFPEAPDYKDLYRDKPIGVSFVEKEGALGMTFGCVACHSGQFLGKTIIGLNNKRSRANQFFLLAKKFVPYANSSFFKLATKASENERRMYHLTRENLKAVGGVAPKVLGLDTSLAHVGLSLSRRKKDSYASKSSFYEKYPRFHPLKHFPSDSRPMPWWNLKYKTRWLSDGSLVSGNPVMTNFLWNEIGRGTDLKKLEKWVFENKDTIKSLTAFVFANKAPHWTDFFPVSTLNLEKAKRGEKVFKKSCQGCHGRYEKAWSSIDSHTLSYKELFKTINVNYPKKTRVVDVGTDDKRWKAMSYLAPDLNRLSFSKSTKTLIIPQKGYVPPPLEGLFLRYPYFHNNSIPNLCALMKREEERPQFFIQGPSLDESTDYDKDCVGYPVGDKIPSSWYKEKEAYYFTQKSGLSSRGHSKAFYDSEGRPKQTEEEKRDLRMFLKTL